MAGTPYLEHCGRRFDWKDLDVQVRRNQWGWFCPACGELLKVDPYNPPPLKY